MAEGAVGAEAGAVVEAGAELNLKCHIEQDFFRLGVFTRPILLCDLALRFCTL